MTQLALDIRDLTVAVLTAQLTDAGTAIEADRIDPIGAGDMPRVLVFFEESGEGIAPAGGPPAFGMRMTLVVQALVEHAHKADAVQRLDQLMLQIELALLEDPVWNRQASQVASMRCSRSFRGDDAMIVGDGRLEFVLEWRQSYETRLGPELTGVDLYIDSRSPFDPNGNYANTEFPAAPPVRTIGPDGRYEVAAKIDFPSDP